MEYEKVDAQRQTSCRNVTFVMRKFSISLPVSPMIAKQGKNSQLQKSSKMCVKTLFVTVTILSPNLLLNDSCFNINGRIRLGNFVEHFGSVEHIS